MSDGSHERLGAIAFRRRFGGAARRWFAGLVVLLVVATITHHLAPEHEAMGALAPGVGHVDHAMPAAMACLGTVETALLLAPVGGMVRLRRARRRRASVPVRGAWWRVDLPRGPLPRGGPPLFLRLCVVRD